MRTIWHEAQTTAEVSKCFYIHVDENKKDNGVSNMSQKESGI